MAKVFSIEAAGGYVRLTREQLAAKYKLTVAELQARQVAGLCYKCNKAWIRGEHKCLRPSLAHYVHPHCNEGSNPHCGVVVAERAGERLQMPRRGKRA